MKIYLASDHAGFAMKNALKSWLDVRGLEVVDCGASVFDAADDYPDFVADAAKRLSADVAAGIDSRALVLGGSGQGEAIVANRFKGVRCAVYYGEVPAVEGETRNMIQLVRDHNNANALSLGARFLTGEQAQAAVEAFLDVPFSGNARHERRIQKIDLVSH